MRTRRRWFTGLRNPQARRASSLAGRFGLSGVALVIPVMTAAVISSSQREMVLASVMSPGMKREAPLISGGVPPRARWPSAGPGPAEALRLRSVAALAAMAGRAGLLLPPDRHSPP
jgi:hypothetical protein